MKRRSYGSDFGPSKGNTGYNPADLVNLYQMIRLNSFERCMKCKAGRCAKFQAHPDALNHWNQEVLNRYCMSCGCHCTFHFYEWFKMISYGVYNQSPTLYDDLGAQNHVTAKEVDKKPWDFAARAFLNDEPLNNTTIEYDYNGYSGSSNNNNNVSNLNSPISNNTNSNMSSPSPNNKLPGNNQFLAQINSPTKFHYVMSDEESQDKELTPVQAPTNTSNFSTNIASFFNASRNGNHSNNSEPSASITPARRKSSETDLKAKEPALKKQKTKEKPTREIAYWATKTVPKDKEPIIKGTSAGVQFKLVRDILKGRLSWADVDPAVVTLYEEKVDNKANALKEVTTDSHWYWVKECKLYFSRNKDGELIGNVELTSPTPKIENRFLREYGPDDFLMVKINKAFPDQAKKGDYDRRKSIVRNFFDGGIWVGNVHYQFCFASATHIRSEKVFFHTNPKKLIAKLGDFSDIRNATKFLARLGQPWSSTRATIDLSLAKVEYSKDLVSESGKEFTDGCGEMALDVMKSIYSTPAFAHVDDSKPLPSAIQIRWGPCKGVLMVNPSLPPGCVRFRESMRKYKIHNPTLCQRQIEVCQESKRFSTRLNKEFIPLLHALGVPDKVFTSLVQKQLDKIRKIGDMSDKQSLKISLDDSRSYFVTKLKLFQAANFSTQDPHFAGLIWKDKQRLLTELKGLRLEVERSCRLLGVWDQSGKLAENQCYVTYRHAGDVSQLIGKVVIMKNPTVHLGDVRVLEAVQCPELNHLENVIVFPVKGKRPIADTIGGGDLDGDMFFVSAYPDIVDNVKEEAPAEYPTPKQRAVREGEDMLEHAKDAYISQVFDGSSMGKITNMFYTLADYFDDGPRNENCLELSKLHAKKVDSAKTGDVIVLSKKLNDLSKQIGSAKFLEQSFGKVVDTKGIVGRLYTMISDAIKDIKEPTYDFKYLDEDLLVNGREKYTQEAKELLQRYNARVREIMQKNKFEDDEERKRIHFEMLEEEFKNIFLEGLNGSHDEAYKKASAWYEVCYKDKKSKMRAFPWVNIDVLTRVKNDKATMKKKSRMAMSIPK
jgi:hypothetical protein